MKFTQKHQGIGDNKMNFEGPVIDDRSQSFTIVVKISIVVVSIVLLIGLWAIISKFVV